MKIAVIGASGNAGSRISAELARRGHSVTAIVRNPERVTAQVNVTPTRGDVTDQAGLARLLTGHDAAISSVRFLASDPVKLIAAARESKSIWSSPSVHSGIGRFWKCSKARNRNLSIHSGSPFMCEISSTVSRLRPRLVSAR